MNGAALTLKENNNAVERSDVLDGIVAIEDPMEQEALIEIVAASTGRTKKKTEAAFVLRQQFAQKAADVVRRAENSKAAKAEVQQRNGIHIDAALEAWNREFAYALMGDKSRVFHMTKERFEIITTTAFHDIFGIEKAFSENSDGSVTWMQIAPIWSTWEGRRTFERVIFDPSGAATDARTYNLWRKFSVEPKAGDWSLLRKHIFEIICRRDPYWFAWFMCWHADMVQRPHLRPGTAIGLKGKKGTGKSTVGHHVAKLFADNAITVSKAEHLTGRFNGHLAQAVFVLVEEVIWGGDKQAEGALKSMITDEEMVLEKKGIDAVRVTSHAHYLFCTNNDWFVPASADERRWFVLEVLDERIGDTAYWDALNAQMEAGGHAAMLHDLLAIKQPAWINLRKPPVTPWLGQQIERSLPTLEMWWNDVLDDGAIFVDERGIKRDITGGWDETTAATVVKTDTHTAYTQWCRQHGHHHAETGNKMGVFMKNTLGVGTTRKSLIEGGGTDTRANMYALPPLGVLREQFRASQNIGVTQDAGTRGGDGIKAWEAYGNGGAGVP